MKFKFYYLFFILLVTSLQVNAQTVPDFTVTDSWGQTHRLYQDYLDQGKTVVLKIFYVSCPPCNAIAPHLDPLYQDWGGGQGDVQFIELSMRQEDSDALINAYKSNHNTTFPAAGGQGNSVAASIPYTNGSFGVWSGTPTFVVIAPDRTLDYDVFGFGIDGTINAIDAAIEATGATGLPTGNQDLKDTTPVRLLSNILTDELILNSSTELSEVQLTITNLIGQKALHDLVQLTKGHTQVKITHLPDGLWICTIENEAQGIVASYLFVKH